MTNQEPYSEKDKLNQIAEYISIYNAQVEVWGDMPDIFEELLDDIIEICNE